VLNADSQFKAIRIVAVRCEAEAKCAGGWGAGSTARTNAEGAFFVSLGYEGSQDFRAQFFFEGTDRFLLHGSLRGLRFGLAFGHGPLGDGFGLFVFDGVTGGLARLKHADTSSEESFGTDCGFQLSV